MSRAWQLAFWAVVAGQITLLLAFIGVKESSLRTGTEVVLRALPVDPRSLLQGDYAILRYEISELPEQWQNLPVGQTVWVILREGPEVWEAESYATFQPEPGSRPFIKGRVEPGNRLDFNIGTFFVPEGSGYIVERSQDTKIVVVLDDDGDAVIKDVLIDGQPFDPSVPPVPPGRAPRPVDPPPIQETLPP